jgi:general secretion pathway protein D
MKPAIRSYLPVVSLVVFICACLIAPPWADAQNPGNPQGNPPNATAPMSAVTSNNQLVSIDFNNVDIGVFIKFISDLTKKNFIVDDKVRGKVTIISPGKITVAEAYKVFESVLEVNGFATVPSGEITKIVPSPDARAKSIRTRLKEETGSVDDSIVTQIIPLRYADPNEIKNLFTPLISRNSIIQAYTPTNTLIVTDAQSNIKRLLHILKTIDITGVGQQIAIIPVENASALKLVTLLQNIFKAGPKGKGPTTKEITFVADERTNVIVMLASEGDVDNVRELVKSLDKQTPKGQGNINVYYLEHASAEDLSKVLMDIPQKNTGTKKEEGKPIAPVVSDTVRIAADKATNSLIITADPEDYAVMEAIIKKIDIPRAMVYIEALIMEVNVEKNFQLGTEWIIGEDGSYKDKQAIVGGGFKSDTALVTYTATGTTSSSAVIPTLPTGLALGVFGQALEISGIKFPSIAAVVQAYQKDRDVRILSNPQILTTDNQEAKIYVGKNIPFQTQATVSTASVGQVYNSFEYKDVGKTLKITPQISKDRMVRLVLSLEVTALESATDNKPTTLKRTVDTTAIVKDGNTVVLGGLIDDTEAAAISKTPCLGDIPGFGFLFSSRATAFTKSNLYVFLTPRVIQNPVEAGTVSNQKREQIDNVPKKINLFQHKGNAPAMEDLQIPAPQNSNDTLPEPPAPRSSRFEKPTYVAEPTQVGSIGAAVTDSAQPRGAAAENDNISGGGRNSSAAPYSQPSEAAVVSAGSVNFEDSAAKSTHEAASTSRKVEGYTLQVASVQTVEKANELLAQLNGRGYAAYTVRTEVDGAVWFRVRIGYFPSKKEAEPVIDKLRADQFTPILIKL